MKLPRWPSCGYPDGLEAETSPRFQVLVKVFAPVPIDSAAATGRPSRIIDSAVHFHHDNGLRISEMAPGVVET